MRAPRPYSPEPADPEAVSPAGPFRAVKQFGLVLLCAAWVALGIAGHDPWKTEDATSIGVASEMADSDGFVVPTLAGDPYLPRPPLAYMGGALAIKMFAPPLQVHNAARVVVALALALILFATALASRELNGRALRWLPVLILVGSVGFWDRAHVLSPELFLTLGMATAIYGLALALRRPWLGGVALGGFRQFHPHGRAVVGRDGEPGELKQSGNWHHDDRQVRRGAVRLGGQHEALHAGHDYGREGCRFFLSGFDQKPGRNLAV